MIAAYIFSIFISHLQAPESFKDQPGIYRQQVELPAQEPLHNEPCGREGCKKPRVERSLQRSGVIVLPPKVKVALPNRVKPQLTEMKKWNSRTRVTSYGWIPPEHIRIWRVSGVACEFSMEARGTAIELVLFPWRPGLRWEKWANVILSPGHIGFIPSWPTPKPDGNI